MGWMGDRSVPRTEQSGYCSANSMAQIPVPVPKSRALLGLLRGARWDFPESVSLQRWCWRSEVVSLLKFEVGKKSTKTVHFVLVVWEEVA